MNQEQAVEYLNRVNWKSLIEWLTAEVLLNRPNDPVQFSRDILGLKLRESEARQFRPGDITSYLTSCYSEATTLVDERGIIHGKSIEISDPSKTEIISELERDKVNLNNLVENSIIIPSLDVDQVLHNVRHCITNSLQCQEAAILITDHQSNEMTMYIPNFKTNIRIPIDEGVAGAVVATKAAVRVYDMDAEPGLIDSFFKATSSVRTICSLAVPISESDEESSSVYGVLLAVNSTRNFGFDSRDEYALSTIALQARSALRNAISYRDSVNCFQRSMTCLDIIRATQNFHGDKCTLYHLAHKMKLPASADSCTLYIVDNLGKGLLRVTHDEVDFSVAVVVGLVGEVARTGQIRNILNAVHGEGRSVDTVTPPAGAEANYQGDSKAADSNLGHLEEGVASRLVLPIKVNGAGEGQDEIVVGVLDLFNKLPASEYLSFNENDIHLTTSLLTTIAPMIFNSSLYAKVQGETRTYKQALSVSRGGAVGNDFDSDEDDD